MKSLLLAAFLGMAIVGCDTPENTTGTDMQTPPADSIMSNPSTVDTVTTTPVDTTGSLPPAPTDTTTR